ncbi:MAG: ABC transporter substrate-binding protein, partial [Candidatus Heimdallarchaeaceae archaeon]
MRRELFLLLLLMNLVCNPLILKTKACVGGCQVGEGFEVFSLNLLSNFEYNSRNNEIGVLLQNTFPKIGVGIDFHEVTTEKNIAERTWSYPFVDYDFIPTYSEGGFDILLGEQNWQFDENPVGRFDSSSFVPYGANFYQFIHLIYDDELSDYLASFDFEERMQHCYDLQEVLYENMPSIPIYHRRELIGLQKTLSGYDCDLIYLNEIHPELWVDSNDNNITYGLPVAFEDYNYFTRRNENKDGLWFSSVYGSLFKREQSTRQWKPEIAQNFSILNVDSGSSHQTMEILIDLEPEVLFSDGSPVLAEDIKYTYELLMSPEVNSKDYNKLLQAFADNNSIEVIDIDTLKFQFQNLDNSPFSLLSYGIVDRSYLEPYITNYSYSIFNQEPLTDDVQDALVKSCGSYVLTEYNYNNNKSVLTPNAYYNNPAINTITFLKYDNSNIALNDFKNGVVDILDPLFTPILKTIKNTLFEDYFTQQVRTSITYE